MSRERSDRNKRLSAALACLAAALSSGCRTSPPPAATTRPTAALTLTLASLVAEVNANNDRIPSLWAKGPFEAKLREAPAESANFFNGDAVTLYLRPDKLRIKGTKAALGTVFDLGSDGRRFWLHLPTQDVLYTGTFAGLDPALVKRLPVRPDLILQVLAVTPLDTDLLATPTPLLRYNPDADAYMLTYDEAVEDPPRRAVVREVWYDRRTLLPTLVVLFDRDGDPTLRAYLTRHRPVGGESGGPRLATRYDLYFPQTGSTLVLDLTGPDEPAVRFKSGRFPSPINFRPPASDAARQVVDLDRASTPGGEPAESE